MRALVRKRFLLRSSTRLAPRKSSITCLDIIYICITDIFRFLTIHARGVDLLGGTCTETPRSSTINERRCVCRHVTRLAVHLLLSVRMARSWSGNPSNRGRKVEIFLNPSKSSYRVVRVVHVERSSDDYDV